MILFFSTSKDQLEIAILLDLLKVSTITVTCVHIVIWCLVFFFFAADGRHTNGADANLYHGMFGKTAQVPKRHVVQVYKQEVRSTKTDSWYSSYGFTLSWSFFPPQLFTFCWICACILRCPVIQYIELQGQNIVGTQSIPDLAYKLERSKQNPLFSISLEIFPVSEQLSSRKKQWGYEWCWGALDYAVTVLLLL